MSKRTRNVLLLAKIETTYGTDPVPVAALNAMHARVTTYQPTVTEFAERANMRPQFGSPGQVQVSNHSEVDVEVELAGAGTAGNAPAYGPLLRACGLKETIDAGVNVIYTPDTDAPETVTFYYNLDGIRHIMTGSRGTVTFDLTSRAIPMMRFHMVGLFEEVDDALMPTDANYDTFRAPLAINKINTPSWSIHGQSGALQSVSIDLGNTVTYRNLIGQEKVVISDRRVSGQASFEMVSVATHAWHEAIRLGTLGALSLTHGSNTGDIIKIDGPKVQLTNPQYADSDGIQMLNVGLDFQPNAGDDEFVLTVM